MYSQMKLKVVYSRVKDQRSIGASEVTAVCCQLRYCVTVCSTKIIRIRSYIVDFCHGLVEIAKEYYKWEKQAHIFLNSLCTMRKKWARSIRGTVENCQGSYCIFGLQLRTYKNYDPLNRDSFCSTYMHHCLTVH